MIDQALYLFGFPDAVFADIRITRENSLVDDWIDILLYYTTFRVRLKAGFFVREAVPSYIIHGKIGSFLKPRGDVQEDHHRRLGRHQARHAPRAPPPCASHDRPSRPPDADLFSKSSANAWRATSRRWNPGRRKQRARARARSTAPALPDPAPPCGFLRRGAPDLWYAALRGTGAP